MIVRAFVLAMLLASTAGAATRLTVGDEVPIGPYERDVPQPTRTRTVMATDGDTILAVHHSADYYLPALYATRFDRNGKLLTPEPIPLVTRTETTGARHGVPPHIFWFRGSYIVFYATYDSKVNALRVTAEGAVIERVALPFDAAGFDVATDGNEFVLVNPGAKLLRLGASLEVLGTVDIPADRYTTLARGVAFGDGRFMIVTVRHVTGVWSRVFENGVLGAEVLVGESRSDGSVAQVVWTGATFVSAWTECASGVYDDDCVGIWAALTRTGEPAGALHVISYQQSTNDYDISLTALDAGTILVTANDDDGNEIGRRYAVNGVAASEDTKLGIAPAGAFLTDGGALMVLDARQRMAWIDAAARAPFPGEMALAPTFLAPPGETLRAAAASATEAAVLHGSILSIVAHDGTPLRDVRLGNDIAGGALASDGCDFFALLSAWPGTLSFYDSRTDTKRVFRQPAYNPFLVWTGTELLAVWSEGDRQWMASLDRQGALLAPPRALETGTGVNQLVAAHGRVLLAQATSRGVVVQLFDTHGQSIGPPNELPNMWTYGHAALATNGAFDALAALDSKSYEMLVSFRPANGTFIAAPNWAKPATDAREAALAPAAGADGFVIVYRMARPVLDTLNIALLDMQGHATATSSLIIGDYGQPILLELAPDRILLVYPRSADEPRYAGATRTFARLLTFEDADAGAVRGGQRR
ncbi:MAG TPA: hypothetical protein VM733_00550 [Thermoanaerobaculia bacterium]|nr:hypothetical protein [Thermoanaerobaculia bacterium]